MCHICKFRFELPDSIRDNAPEYTEEEVHSTYCRAVGILEAYRNNGFEISASIDSSEFHHHTKGTKCTEICGDVNYVLIVGERGHEAVAIQFFLGANNGIHIASTTRSISNVEGMQVMFKVSKKKVTPLITIQKWVDDANNERLGEDYGKHIFLYCYYTDADLDADWEVKASRCFSEALRVASKRTRDKAKDRALAVRSNLKRRGREKIDDCVEDDYCIADDHSVEDDHT